MMPGQPRKRLNRAQGQERHELALSITANRMACDLMVCLGDVIITLKVRGPDSLANSEEECTLQFLLSKMIYPFSDHALYSRATRHKGRISDYQLPCQRSHPHDEFSRFSGVFQHTITHSVIVFCLDMRVNTFIEIDRDRILRTGDQIAGLILAVGETGISSGSAPQRQCRESSTQQVSCWQ